MIVFFLDVYEGMRIYIFCFDLRSWWQRLARSRAFIHLL